MKGVMNKVLCVLCVLVWCGLGAQQAWGTKICKSLYKAKRFGKAGECYESLARAMGNLGNLKEEQKNHKGRLLRNAAISYRKYANKLKDVAKAGQQRERALKLLDLYLKERLCETPERCKLTETLRDAINKEVGYALLVVNTKHSKAEISVVGYSLSWKHTGTTLRKEIRPGSYVVTVNYPKAPPQVKKIVVKFGQPVVESFQPPSPQLKGPGRERVPAVPGTKKPSLVPWIVAGVGGAVLLAGVGLTIAGGVMNQQVWGEVKELGGKPKQVEDTTRLNQSIAQAQGVYAGGWVAIAVGAVAAGGGVVWALLQGGTKGSAKRSVLRRGKRSRLAIGAGAKRSAQAGFQASFSF